MPRLRPKRNELARFVPPTDIVYAVEDVSKGGSFVRKGESLPRNHVMVKELPTAFEVRYPLILEEVNDG
jgi:hypothetical protein